MRYRMRLLTLPLLLLVCAALPLKAQVEGVFEAIGTVPAKHSVDVVVFEEYLNFTCPHCNTFRLASIPLRTRFGNRVQFQNIPILFRGQSDAIVRLFYIAQRAGNGEQMKDTIFEAAFKYGVNINDPAIVSYLARSSGLGPAYEKDSHSEWVNQKVLESSRRANEAGITATPTVILQGTIRVTPKGGMDVFIANLDQIIGQLLKEE